MRLEVRSAVFSASLVLRLTPVGASFFSSSLLETAAFLAVRLPLVAAAFATYFTGAGLVAALGAALGAEAGLLAPDSSYFYFLRSCTLDIRVWIPFSKSGLRPTVGKTLYPTMSPLLL